jgi:hypothetical protein
MRPLLLWMLAGLFTLVGAGCSFTPVRHLASDAALIQPGESTLEDVLRYLGQPDGRRTVAPGVEELLYAEERKGGLSSLPLLDRVVDPDSHEMVLVTLERNVVTNCEFRLIRKKDRAWKKKISWDDVR